MCNLPLVSEQNKEGIANAIQNFKKTLEYLGPGCSYYIKNPYGADNDADYGAEEESDDLSGIDI